MKQVTKNFALENRCFVLEEKEESIVFAVEDSHDDPYLKTDLEYEFRKNIALKKISTEEFFDHCVLIFDLSSSELAKIQTENGIFEEIKEHDRTVSSFVDEQNVIDQVNRWISQAIYQKASDLHFEIHETHAVLRYRIDGKLHDIEELSKEKFPAIISRLKIMSDLDIGEKRRPQDGRIKVSNGNKSVDIRVSLLPTEFGEKAVLRLLDKTAIQLSLSQIGFSGEQEKAFKRAISYPYGMVLVTGPTGSGKTTTLYSGLNYLNNSDVNILTVEDPIEYNLDRINQTHVKADIGFTFASALRSFLRQDPNIIMVGEIRDQETADIAVRAALTGHMLLSTLHTNDSPSTIARLLDMGIEPFLIASSLRLVMAQRLVRKICSHCKEEVDISVEDKKRIGLDKNAVVYHGKGCKKCFSTGYKGRTAIIELMSITENMASLITQRADLGKIRKQAFVDGMKSLQEIAKDKVLSGETTVEEILREILI
jgi:type IV pilus assembly protein PilB